LCPLREVGLFLLLILWDSKRCLLDTLGKLLKLFIPDKWRDHPHDYQSQHPAIRWSEILRPNVYQVALLGLKLSLLQVEVLLFDEYTDDIHIGSDHLLIRKDAHLKVLLRVQHFSRNTEGQLLMLNLGLLTYVQGVSDARLCPYLEEVIIALHWGEFEVPTPEINRADVRFQVRYCASTVINLDQSHAGQLSGFNALRISVSLEIYLIRDTIGEIVNLR